MKAYNPPNTAAGGSTGLDWVITKIQQAMETLPWIERSYGRAWQLRERGEDGVARRIPATNYSTSDQQGGQGAGGYQNCFPNDAITAHSFMFQSGVAVNEQGPGISLIYGVPLTLIVSANLEKIDPDKGYYYVEELAAQVLQILTTVAGITVAGYQSDPVEEVWAPFEANLIDEAMLYYPYAAIRFDLVVPSNLANACDPALFPPPKICPPVPDTQRSYVWPILSQRVSYRQGDEGWQLQNIWQAVYDSEKDDPNIRLVKPVLTNFYNLQDPNNFGNTSRFTQTDGTPIPLDAPVNGTETIDHYLGIVFINIRFATDQDWPTTIDLANAFDDGSWVLMPRLIFWQLLDTDFSNGAFVNRALRWVANGRSWSSSTLRTNSNQAVGVGGSGNVDGWVSRNKTGDNYGTGTLRFGDYLYKKYTP